jgi:hypothetical protein
LFCRRSHLFGHGLLRLRNLRLRSFLRFRLSHGFHRLCRLFDCGRWSFWRSRSGLDRLLIFGRFKAIQPPQLNRHVFVN